ncbi:MAG: lytic transglycosylase domain-containing protein [Bacteroides sp.]|nr:lytic transglycosylase domain-containing protein [Bacteroides sp.]
MSCVLIATVAVLSILTGSSPVTKESAGTPAVTYIHSPGEVAPVVPPTVPASVEFAGQDVDLQRYDLRERMDRELMAFSYMHSTTLLMIKRANRYFPVIEPILKENGIPDDFKYLMVIENNLNPFARSSAGAAGLWQFMEATGREYGLEVNKNIDERYHVEKATVAACKYLKDAYSRYGDWLTVAASYNAGKGRISSELSKQEVTSAMDLWLVEETVRYMFRIIAAKQFFSDPAKFGFILRADQLYPPIPYEKITVKTSIADLARYAKDKGITYYQLIDANPWLRSTSLENKTGRTYTLHIPTQEGMHYDPNQIPVHNKNWIAP